VVAYRTARWKFIYEGLSGQHELYDLANDRREETNVVERYPAVAAQMRRVVEAHLSSLKPAAAALPDEPVSIEVVERLKALGYIE